MKRSIRTLLMALVVVVLLATPALANVTVKATGSDNFKPATVHIARGEKVTWKNVTDHTKHSVTADGTNWDKDKTIQPGSSTSFTFHANGTYKYHCVFHSGMTGKIVVG